MLTDRITAATIRHPKPGYSNPPELRLEVSSMPDFTYEELRLPDGRTYYFAETEGFCSFYSYNPQNERGFAGSIFPLTLKSGEVRQVKGPWSSRSGVMNRHFPHCAEVEVRDLDRGYLTASALLVPTFQEVLATYIPEWALVLGEDDKDGDLRYDLTCLPLLDG